jgi:hypothetical protein
VRICRWYRRQCYRTTSELAGCFSQRRSRRATHQQWLAARGFEGVSDVQRRAQEVSVAEYVALTSAGDSQSRLKWV